MRQADRPRVDYSNDLLSSLMRSVAQTARLIAAVVGSYSLHLLLGRDDDYGDEKCVMTVKRLEATADAVHSFLSDDELV